MRSVGCWLALGGCFQASDRPGSGPNDPPAVVDGAAYVWFDLGSLAEVLSFEAIVSDADGLGDVTEVWADVYDDGAGGVYQTSFPLYPTVDATWWLSDWYADTTLLDLTYPGYGVDLVVYDTAGEAGVLTVPLELD